MTKEELNALRREALNAQRRANNKVSRLKAKGVHIRATVHDPRADFEKIARYTAKQLISHIDKLDKFNSRANSFVAGNEGKPIPKALFQKYKKLEAEHNAIANERMDERGHVIAPGTGMTIREREDTIYRGKRAQGDAVARPFTKFERDSTNINGVDALTKLIKDYEKKNRKSTIGKVIKDQRRQLSDMLTTIGDADLIAKAQLLSSHQFDILFNDTAFAGDVSLKYEIIQSLNAGRKQAWFDSVGETKHREIREALEWAATLPKTKPNARGEKG